MSGDTYGTHETYREKSPAEADSPVERELLGAKRAERVRGYRDEVDTKAKRPHRPQRDTSEEYDPKLVRLAITQPGKGVKRVYVILIDNSGSNRQIAQHFKNSSNYLRVNLQWIDPEAQFLFVYFSDHCDGDGWWQAIDWISPTEDGEKILISTLFEVRDVNGGDAPEAHECALWDAAHLDFGSTVEEKHLILVSDVTGHNMGMSGDKGCPKQRSWESSLDLVNEIFTTFEVIGCGDDPADSKLQEQFITHAHPELLPMNFVSLSYIHNPEYRLGIVLNTFLFLAARHSGMQAIEGFLARLYEKWLDDPLFGGETDRRAKETILRFAKFVPGTDDEIRQMMSRILVTSVEEVEDILKHSKITI
jgi:hypothetical protein